MGDAPLLSILVGAPPTLGEIGAAPTLILEADAQRCSALKLELFRRNLEAQVQLRACVLTAAPGTPVTWFCFSDSRLNGPLPLEHWLPRFPNLTRAGEERLHGDTLAEVLSGWEPARAGQARLNLSVRQGDPLALLAGAGPWMDRISAFRLQGASSDATWQEALHQRLSDLGLQRSDAQVPHWHRPPAVSLQPRARPQACEDQSQEQESCDAYKAALEHLFPEALYRQKRPDLEALNRNDLIAHFVHHGRQEGTVLDVAEMENRIRRLQQERDRLQVQIAELGSRAEQTSEQLAALKDLVARLTVLRQA